MPTSRRSRSPLPRLLAALTARPRIVLGVAVALLAAMAVLGHGVSGRLLNGGTLNPASPSSRGAALLNRHFPASSPNLILLVRTTAAGQTMNSPAVARSGDQLTRWLTRQRVVIGVTSYWPGQPAALRSRDGDSALIVAHLPGPEDHVARVYRGLAPHLAGRHGPITVALGGLAPVNAQLKSTIAADLRRAELIALPLTLIILLLVFGSVVAALLPLLVGVSAILATNAMLALVTQFTDVSVFAQNLTTALGLGLGIDYALLMVRRFREIRTPGQPSRDAVLETLTTAGATIGFSALIVAISLSAMLLFPIYFLRSFAYAGICVVLFAALTVLTVVPAALVLLGHRIDALSLPWRRPGRAGHSQGSGWQKLTSQVMRRAPLYAVGTLLLLAVAGLPFLGVHFGVADYRQLPASAQARIVQQDVQDQFPGTPGAQIDVVGRLPATGAGPALARYAARLSALPDVAQVTSAAGEFRDGTETGTSPADAAQSAGGYSYLSVTPVSQAISARSQDLVRVIRRQPAPFGVLVTGSAANIVDEQHTIGAGLPAALALIAAATLVLVFLFTGSVLIPVLTVISSALSLSAMFGVAVWIFQDGHGAGLLGFTSTGFIDVSLPMLMFCVAFGLSMDYSVFLLSRIAEEHRNGRDSRAAIVVSVGKTGGIVTAAAIILAVVLLSIGTSQVTNIKMLGLGVAVAVLTDAFLVRCLLVPAVLALAGEAIWWAPGPLARLYRRWGLRERTPAPGERPHVVGQLPEH